MLTEFHVRRLRVLLSSYASSGTHAELCVRAKSPLQRREENTDANRQQAVNIALWTQTMKRYSKHMRRMRKRLPHCVTPQSYLWIWGHFKARSLQQTRNASMRGKENWYEESESVAFGERPHQKSVALSVKPHQNALFKRCGQFHKKRFHVKEAIQHFTLFLQIM